MKNKKTIEFIQIELSNGIFKKLNIPNSKIDSTLLMKASLLKRIKEILDGVVYEPEDAELMTSEDEVKRGHVIGQLIIKAVDNSKSIFEIEKVNTTLQNIIYTAINEGVELTKKQ